MFAADMLGAGVAGNRDRVIATLTALRDDVDLLVGRADRGLRLLSGLDGVDGRHAAVGFCFGGLTVLTLARSGAQLAGVVSMHGSLKTPRPAQPGRITAKVLACHGAADPHVPLAEVTDFAAEMDRARADWQLVMYGGTLHGFTHDQVVPGTMPGVGYHEAADRRSFALATSFLEETFTAAAVPAS